MQVEGASNTAVAEVEDRLQRKMDEFCQQQKAAQHMMKNDLAALQNEVKNRFARQETKNAELHSGFQKLESSVASAISTQLQTITSSIQQSQADLLKPEP